ncbi:MAG: hypothetical protein RLZZ324_418 [Candidatus Parcubacteria bacterium]|jgi:NAD(P)-dependent dehydrogenase (short-subunit alcohol dehydrogenase family)
MRSQTILITGAASGIGFASALLLLQRGHSVIATDRNEDLLRAFDPHRAAHGSRLRTAVLDVTVPAHAAFAAQNEHDVLLGCAGIGDSGPIAEMPEDRLRALFETNVFGTLRVIQAALPAMLARRHGRIVTVTSIAGVIPVPYVIGYAMSKFALEAMNDGLRRETAGMGIDVVAIEPGNIDTGFNQRMNAQKWLWMRPESAWKGRWEALKRCEREFWDKGGVPARVPARAIVQAIEARKPKHRYLAPSSGIAFTWAARTFPSWLNDAILHRMMGV